MESMTIAEVIQALNQIGDEYGMNIPVAMLPSENDEPYAISSVNIGFDEDGQPIANFTTDE